MGTPYMISYDLHAPGQRYSDVKEVIDNFGGAYIKILESTWLVNNNLTPDEMSDRLKVVFDSNDSLFITKISRPYQGLLQEHQWEFIREHIYPNNGF
ncbi:hypothetical protein [Convivina intestini]|uniref:hypothetical protein n=1 Tax=Convivina intestini TaxID=1505726 RepID=UPI00200BD890|nr:hypothetical protein [Convivina intestini]CAH1853888.1 hypothetical protein R078131_00857 [Convivina intestini]